MNKENKKVALTGGSAMVEALRQINPDVMPIYPITPQTIIIEEFAKISAEGKVETEMVTVESEHSAISVCVGASSAGARTVTATSSQGLALMNEILHTVSGSRLPILMLISSRALSSPLNIHCDHSDVMSVRDTGWIQIFSENSQEAYNNTIIGLKVAEKSSLPVMVIMDGFITSHCVENLEILSDEKVKKFVGDFNPKNSLLDVKNPVTFGAISLPDSYFEFKVEQEKAMSEVGKIFQEVSQEFYQIFYEKCCETGHKTSSCKIFNSNENSVENSNTQNVEFQKLENQNYDVFESYEIDDAEKIIVLTGSTAGMIKDVIDEKRKKGEKVGLLKIKLFRPFPFSQIVEKLKNAKKVAVLDRSISSGSKPPIYSDVISALHNVENSPKIYSYVYGLGGRDIFKTDIEKVFTDLDDEKNLDEVRFLFFRKSV